MTAVTQYARLEAPGLFTPGQGAQRIDVILSLGAATLTISDRRETALAHWSLAALERQNPGVRPAVYAPGDASPDWIETDDDTMIRALEKVRTAVDRGRPHPGRLRLRLLLAAIAAGLGVAVFWLPGALVSTTARLVPDAARTAIGTRMLDEIAMVAGAPCAEPSGVRALDRLVLALVPAGPATARVLPGGPPGAWALPGGAVVMNRSAVEDHETPQVAAGVLLAGALAAEERDPLVRLLEDAGIAATIRLVTTGRLPERAVAAHARALLAAPPPAPDLDRLARRFAEAGVPAAPYAYALDPTGEATLALIEAGEAAGAPERALLPDSAWVALQGICGG